MSDTTTISAEERALWLAEAQPKNIDYYEPIDFELDKRIRNLIGALEQAESRAEKSEAENTRLTKMVDWLASHTADICASVYQDSYDLHWWTDCEWKEAALRAVAAGEETYQK